MAFRGTRPTARVVHLATGNRSRRPLRPEPPVVEGKPQKPAKLKGRASQLWDQVVMYATWLTILDGHKLFLWCCLQAEAERAPAQMNAARIGQLRGLGAELGLDPSARLRLGTASDARSDADERVARRYGL